MRCQIHHPHLQDENRVSLLRWNQGVLPFNVLLLPVKTSSAVDCRDGEEEGEGVNKRWKMGIFQLRIGIMRKPSPSTYLRSNRKEKTMSLLLLPQRRHAAIRAHNESKGNAMFYHTRPALTLCTYYHSAFYHIVLVETSHVQWTRISNMIFICFSLLYSTTILNLFLAVPLLACSSQTNYLGEERMEC